MKDSWSLADPTKLCQHACARCMHSSSQCHKCWYILNKIFRMRSHWIHSWKHAKWLKSFIKVHLCDFSATTSHLQPLSFISWMCALVPFRSFWGVFISFWIFWILFISQTPPNFMSFLDSGEVVQIYSDLRRSKNLFLGHGNVCFPVTKGELACHFATIIDLALRSLVKGWQGTTESLNLLSYHLWKVYTFTVSSL